MTGWMKACAIAALAILAECAPAEVKPEAPRIEVNASKTSERLNVRLPIAGFRYERRGEMAPKAVVLHASGGKTLYSTIMALESRNIAVHLLVDTDGTIYRLTDRLEERGKAVRGLDDVAIHLCAIGGREEDLLLNNRQLQRMGEAVRVLCEEYRIPPENFNIEAKSGVFSHTQAKYKFGGFLPNDTLEPGEKYTREVLRLAGGKYYAEEEWKDRYEGTWTLVRERPDVNRKRGALTRGRGLTATPTAALRSVARDREGRVVDGRRIQYVDRGKIEIRGIVLHFTATKTYEATVRALEDRRLCSTLIVDTDGRAYQVMDALDDKPAAAGGTNEYCVQIEIVGENETSLLNNRAQTERVRDVVRELCAKFSIPRDNHDIGALRGIFSHGQAKKRFGRSAWLWGDEFDPGETYMRTIIEGIGGRYYRESEWNNRRSEEWIFLFDDWHP